jgi:hypothetical protein
MTQHESIASDLKNHPKTLSELIASGWRSRSVKEEMRENFLRSLESSEELYPGIIGYQDTVWNSNVAEALLLKQQEKYYSMPIVKHGYCYAKEPYQFVGKIEALYEHYKTHK